MKGEKFMEEILSNGLYIIPNITRRIKENWCNLWKIIRKIGGIQMSKKKIILVLPENDFSFLQQNTLEYLMRYSATKLVVLDLQRYQKVWYYSSERL